MKKMTFGELVDAFYKHNEENNVTSQFEDKKCLLGVVVFKDKGVNKGYSLESRSYVFTSDNKYFIAGMGGNSIFANNLDKTDHGVRLDWYLGTKGWDIDYCYIKEKEVA